MRYPGSATEREQAPRLRCHHLLFLGGGWKLCRRSGAGVERPSTWLRISPKISASQRGFCLGVSMWSIVSIHACNWITEISPFGCDERRWNCYGIIVKNVINLPVAFDCAWRELDNSRLLSASFKEKCFPGPFFPATQRDSYTNVYQINMPKKHKRGGRGTHVYKQFRMA